MRAVGTIHPARSSLATRPSPPSKEAWKDVTIHGPDSHMRGVRAPDIEPRPWLEGFSVCRALSQYHILHVGIHSTRTPTRIVRTKQTSTYFLACTRGQGRVLIDGHWRICAEGHASLLPAHTLNAFESIPELDWEYCWVCYQLPPEQRPIADATTPVLARYESAPLRHAVQGLMHECAGPAQPGLIQAWTELVHAYVMRFARPPDHPDHLKLLWERVASNLGQNWTLTRLSKEAGYSNEHLRRLCHRQLGRSPVHQVTYLRMKRAAELLVSTEKTIEAICQEVGYQNPFVFSNSFTKWIGWRPSEYRRKNF